MKKLMKVLEVTGETVENLLELVLNYWQLFAISIGLMLVLELHELRQDVRVLLNQTEATK